MNDFMRVAVALSVVLTYGCATGDPAGSAVADRSGPVCLNDYDIRSFNPVDDEFLYVEGRSDSHYLFTLQRGCIGIRSANVIGIPDTPGRICSNSLDSVIYRDFAAGQTSCRILNIERISSRAEARELAEVRREARRDAQREE